MVLYVQVLRVVPPLQSDMWVMGILCVVLTAVKSFFLITVSLKTEISEADILKPELIISNYLHGYWLDTTRKEVRNVLFLV